MVCALLLAGACLTPHLSSAQDAGAPTTTPARVTGYANPETSARPTTHAVRAAQPPVIDGRLDEASWRDAEVLTDFVQQLPNTGYPARFRTVVRVLYDADHLYVGAENFDPEPDKLITAGIEHDFNTGNSDIFGVVFDTFHDRRNAFLFAINPHGAVRDEQVFNDSRNIVEAWEGIVDVKTRMTDSSWIVEMAIPLKTLRFDGHRATQDWGINFIRRVRRANETSYWAPLERQYRLHRMSKAGTITDLQGLRQGRNLQVKPYVVADRSSGAQVPAAALGSHGDAGLDVKYGVTPSLTLDLTYNTDFSQVEVDQEQVNLTRFSLFFPERREFFIENAGLFTLGDVEERNYRMGAALKDFTFFNSRRIGLTADGRPIPILGGGRLSGRVGAWDVGLLDMQTQRTVDGSGENFGVVRARRNVSEKSDVGFMVQRRAATDSGGAEAMSYGVDANLRPVGNMIINAYAVASEAPGGGSDGYAARTSVAFRNRLWNTSAMVKRVSDQFNPAMGFVRRRGMQQSYGTVGLHLRPAWRGIQEVAPYVELDYITDLRGQLDTRSLQVGTEVQFQPEGTLTFELQDQFDRLEQSFTVFPGRTIPVGAYAWREGMVKVQSAQARPLSVLASLTTGGFYDGSRRSYGGTATWRVRYNLSIDGSFTRNDVTLASGPFLADIASTRIRYAWSTRLFGSAYVQYNAQSKTMVTNARLNFRYAPLSDLFLVFTDRRNADTGVRNERTVSVKLTRMLAF